MIKDILNDIEKAIENEAYFSALALTLTIPDICGKIENTNIGKDKCKYMKWFNDWVYPYYKVIYDPKDEKFYKYEKLLKFDGNLCYALRCAVLHSGNYKVEKNKSKITRFELCMNEGEFQSGESEGVYESDGEIVEVHKRVNVILLLQSFIKGTKDFLKKYGDDSEEYGIMQITII